MSRLWSIPVKAMLLAAAVLSVVAVVQAWILLDTVRADLPLTWASLRAEAVTSPGAIDGAARRLVAALAALYVGCVAISGLFAFAVTRHRTARLTRVLQQIADGKLNATLEPLLDTDLAVVRHAVMRMQAALTEMTGQLRHIDAQRRRLFADLAHELATPTSTILGVSEALADHAPHAADRRRFEQVLEQEATRLERLVADVRELAHLDDPDSALERAAVDVAVLARDAAARLNALATGAAPVTVAAAPAWAVADARRIDQVLVNLLSNARRYTPPEGVIAVAVAPEGARVRLTVEDSGAGVPDEMLPRLGERLLRIDPSRSVKTGGHGLGLSIVSAIVQRHGGELRFERAALGGLRVVVTLPAAGAPPTGV